MSSRLSLVIVLSLMFGSPVYAADQYVRFGAGGAGTNWTDAWSNTTNINWSTLSPGDTVWIAGSGTIYAGFGIAQSGNADNPGGRIFVKRATVSAHGTETGWSAAYDTQVKLTQIYWSTVNKGAYVTIDGQVEDGIRIDIPAGTAAAVQFNRGAAYVTLRYINLSGPCGPTPCNQIGDNRGIDMTPFNSGAYDSSANFLLQYSKIHGFCTLIMLFNSDNAVIERNTLYDSGTTVAGCHPNVLYTTGSNQVTFRYNAAYNYSAEGIIMSGGDGASGTWDIYGNVFYRTSEGSSGPFDRVIETREGDNGPIHFYNNTVVGLWQTWNGAGGTWATGTASTNNIYWNTPGNNAINPSYDFCSIGTCTGTGTIVSGSNPFQDYTGFNFRLLETVSAVYPRNKGTALGAPYDTDLEGHTRGADGLWDMGAYELFGNPPPAQPTGLTMANFRGNTFAVLLWPHSTDTDFSSYVVYKTATCGTYGMPLQEITSTWAAARSTPMTQYFDSTLYTAGTYCYKIGAKDVDGNLSTLSSEVSITVTGKQ